MQPVDLMREVMPIIATDTVAWTVVAAPNHGWAESVLGTPDVERLWRAVAIATRLDRDDPVQAWRDHLAKLQLRRDMLNARGVRPDPVPRAGHRPDSRPPAVGAVDGRRDA